MTEDELPMKIVLDFRIQIDDVDTDFRASIYDPEDLELMGEGWGDTPLDALLAAFRNYQEEGDENYQEEEKEDLDRCRLSCVCSLKEEQ